jgi:hypothetical protein
LHWLNRRSASVRAVLQLLYTEAISPSGFSLHRGRATRDPRRANFARWCGGIGLRRWAGSKSHLRQS